MLLLEDFCVDRTMRKNARKQRKSLRSRQASEQRACAAAVSHAGAGKRPSSERARQQQTTVEQQTCGSSKPRRSKGPSSERQQQAMPEQQARGGSELCRSRKHLRSERVGSSKHARGSSSGDGGAQDLEARG